MGEIFNYFKKKKNLVSLLILGIFILGVPLGVNLVKLQQIITSRAEIEPIAFTGSNVTKRSDGSWVTKTATVSFQLTSPLGPPATSSAASIRTDRNSGGLVKTAYAASCDGSLSFTCNTYPNHRLSASWNVTDEFGGCNIYIQDSTGDHKISASCSGSWSDTKVAGTALTNDGHYKLYVSNGGTCNNQQKGDVTLNCAVGNCSAAHESARAKLIELGGNFKNSSCDEVKNAVCTNCTIFVPPNAIRTALCPGTCGGISSPSPSPSGNPGNCPVDNKLTVSPNPAKVGDTVTFQYQAGEDVYLGDDTFNPSSSVSACKIPGSTGNPLADRRYICTASSATSNGTWKHLWNVGQPNGPSCGSATYVISAAASPSPAPTFTTKFKIAEQQADLNSASWQDYTTTVASTPYTYTFKDQTPGQKFIFVQFMDSANNVTNTTTCPKCQASIKLLGPDPVMTSCSLSFENNSAILNLKGQNFGSDRGTIKSGDNNLEIRLWKQDNIQAILQNVPTGQVLPIIITNSDGQSKTDQCSSISQLSLGAKVFCRAPASHDAENVDIVLVDETGKKMKQVVRIDKNGVVQGLDQRLEDGKRYALSIKAPRSLRRNVSFAAGGGTVSIPNFILPVGDIFPVDGGDGVINASDKAELNRQFVLTQSGAGRSGDFNQDGRVNSIDWACMRYDYGQSDDPQPVVPAPVASPSPSPSASPSPSPSPSASPSPSPSP